MIRIGSGYMCVTLIYFMLYYCTVESNNSPSRKCRPFPPPLELYNPWILVPPVIRLLEIPNFHPLINSEGYS